MKLNSKQLLLATAIGLVLSPGLQASDCDGGTYCADFTELMDYLQSEERRSSGYRIVQARFGMDTVTPPHEQYPKSCSYFGIAPILEQLGYTQFKPRGSYDFGLWYASNDGLKSHTFDVGYHLSPEHLMGIGVKWESSQIRCEWDGGDYVCDPFPQADEDGTKWEGFYTDDSLTEIDTSNKPCSRRFAPGEGYGQCNNPATDNYEAWLDVVNNGGRGMARFANQWLQNYAGCNDMRGFRPDPYSFSEKTHMRRVVKGFVDNNLPLLVSVRRGGHFMNLIGYYDLEGNGLPRKAILHDSYGSYRLAELTTHWNVHDNRSLRDLLPWNQHLDGACDAGGWASSLDEELTDRALPAEFKLCTMPDNVSQSCVQERVFGAELICEDDGTERSRYFAYEDDLFITETDNTSCDTVKLRYADGEREIESVSIRRFGYSPDSEEWVVLSGYRPDLLWSGDDPIVDSPISYVEWNEIWPNDYWLVADGLHETHTKRRATVHMTFNDGSSKKLEISPPETYGFELQCIDDRMVRATYKYEADHGVFRVADTRPHTDRQFLYESGNRSCDALKLRVNLGEATNVASATVQRKYYNSGIGEWAALHPVWRPDDNSIVYDGLSGETREIMWDRVWPDDHWLVAEDVEPGKTSGDRKTVISLRDGDLNLIREIEVVPY